MPQMPESRPSLRPVRWVQMLRMQGKPVLSLTLSLPRVTGDARGCAVIDRHYAKLRDAWRSRWTGPLYQKAAQEVLSQGCPPWTAVLDHTVTLHTEDLLSLFWTACITTAQGSHAVRCGECWNVKTGALLTLSDVLPAGVRRRALLSALEQEAGKLEEQGLPLKPDWQTLLRRRFQPDRFWRTADATVFFFPPGLLAPPESGFLLLNCSDSRFFQQR